MRPVVAVIGHVLIGGFEIGELLELFLCSRVFKVSDGSEWGVGPKNGSEVAGDF